MFVSASQGGEQADQLYFGMLGSLIAFLWSADKHLQFGGSSYFPASSQIFTQNMWKTDRVHVSEPARFRMGSVNDYA